MTGSLSTLLTGLNTPVSPGRLSGLSPLPKVSFVLVFLVLTVSFGRYDCLGSSCFAPLPFLLAGFNGNSPVILLRRAALALPFVLCTGAANLFLDREPVALVAGTVAPGGMISLWVLLAKTLATTGMVLLLAMTTSISGICRALAGMHVPCLLILQLQLLCRYLVLTAREAENLANGYFLRAPGSRLIPVREWGMLFGRLFLRSVERSEAIYRAMQCRLFRADETLRTGESGTSAEWVITLLFLAVLIFLRVALS